MVNKSMNLIAKVKMAENKMFPLTLKVASKWYKSNDINDGEYKVETPSSSSFRDGNSPVNQKMRSIADIYASSSEVDNDFINFALFVDIDFVSFATLNR